MHLHLPLCASILASNVAARPYNPWPLHDGFPNPSPQQLTKIEAKAGGSLPTSPPPAKLEPSAIAALQLIAANENFEVAFFTDLLHNITTNVAGFDLANHNRSYIIDSMTKVQKQEEIHALGVNDLLAAAKGTTIQPCKYQFPVTDYLSAIKLANTFTDVVLGVLPSAQMIWAADGGDELPFVNLFGSIIAQEAEQNGWYRFVQSKSPSAAPLLTTEAPAFAWTFLQSVIVPGSCPNNDILTANFPTFGALNVLSKLTDKNQTVTYSVSGTVSSSANSLTYLSGRNTPLSVPISNIKCDGNLSYFDAELPFQAGFAKGLTVAAVTKGVGAKFITSTDVANATLFGPGIIEID